MRRTIALATSSSLPDSIEDDRRLLTALRDSDSDARYVIWDDPAIDWSGFDAVVIRTCWDYSRRIGEFLAWITRIESDTQVVNPSDTLRWNTDKRYLLEVAGRGVSIPRSVLYDPDDGSGLVDAVRQLGERSIVIKPCISASANHTFLLHDPTNDDISEVARQTEDRGTLLIQRFVPEIQTAGEISLLYFDGEFSHAARKIPGKGDFRVQGRFGGRVENCQPADSLIKFGRDALRNVEKSWLYARVDVVPAEPAPFVMELELVEPELFFRCDDSAGRRFADVLIDAIE